MAEEIRLYGRGYGKLWPSLLEDTDLDWKARLCFGVMGSFGIASRASLKSIARRMGLKDTKAVTQAQRALQKKGWLYLVAEGAGRHPRAWYIADMPFDWERHPEAKAEVMDAMKAESERRGVTISWGAEILGGGFPGGLSDGGAVEPPPKQEKTLINSDRPKQEKVPANAGGASKLIAIFCEEHSSLKGSTYKLSGKDAGQAKVAAKQNPDFESWFRPAVRAYLKDDWAKQTGFTLSAMLAQLNKWAAKASGSKQPCKHLETEVVENRGDAAAHKCKACGLVTWK